MTEILNRAISKFWGDKPEIPIEDASGVPGIMAIDISVENAVKDLMARTLKRRTNAGDKIKPLIIKTITEPLRSLYSVKMSQNEFDAWHHGTCVKVLETLQSQYTNTDGTAVHYGKAQKIVNMTLKYLLCMKGAEKYESNLQYCHMPLDSYTLEWIKRACKKAHIKVTSGKMASWSVLDYDITNDFIGDKGKEKYTYNFFVKTVRKLAEINYGYDSEKYGKLTSLQAEFFIWPHIQMELAAEAFIIQFKSNYGELSDKEKKAIKDIPLEEKIETVASLTRNITLE